MKRTFENDYPFIWARIVFFKSTFLQWIEMISEVYSYLFDASLFKAVFLSDFKWDFFLLLTFRFSPKLVIRHKNAFFLSFLF